MTSLTSTVAFADVVVNKLGLSSIAVFIGHVSTETSELAEGVVLLHIGVIDFHPCCTCVGFWDQKKNQEAPQISSYRLCQEKTH